MRRPLVHLSIQLAVLACSVSAAACARRAEPKTGAETTVAGRLDSLRTASKGRTAKRSGVQSVTFTDADRTRFNSLEQMIAAKFSGVQVTQRGSGYSIRIRGAESFQSATEPLVVVDGAIMSTADLGALNVKDVVRIEILKDSAASIYGVRGGNGVIVVTTDRLR